MNHVVRPSVSLSLSCMAVEAQNRCADPCLYMEWPASDGETQGVVYKRSILFASEEARRDAKEVWEAIKASAVFCPASPNDIEYVFASRTLADADAPRVAA